MKGYYLRSDGDEIVIPATGQVYPVDSKRTFNVFLNAKEGEEGRFDEWEANQFEQLQSIDENDVSAIEEWISGGGTLSPGIIACRDDKTGELEVYDQSQWDQVLEEYQDKEDESNEDE